MAARLRGRRGPARGESLAWIRALAEPYLREYQPVRQAGGGLRGYWFLAGAKSRPPLVGPRAGAGRRKLSSRGFFVGYLGAGSTLNSLGALPPECLVFVFVQPVNGGAHRRLVRRKESLLRNTFTYIRYLTHRPPRFEFYEQDLAAMVRHHSMRGWPRAKWKHHSRNFFIETLAWLVRSALVRKLSVSSRPPSP